VEKNEAINISRFSSRTSPALSSSGPIGMDAQSFRNAFRGGQRWQYDY
jgi:hypothetical protein